MGITGMSGFTIFKPSIADTTVIAGVITPSANNMAPPIMANTNTHFARFRIKAKSANIPPSPLLSARKVIMIYFMVVCNVNVQITQEIAP